MVAKVIVDISTSEIDRIFDYGIPHGIEIVKGDRVTVPFGSRQIEGIVIDVSEEAENAEITLKDILSKPDDFTAVTPEMLELLDFMRRKYYLRYADVLRLFLPAGMRGKSRLKRKPTGKKIPFKELAVDCKKVALTKDQQNAVDIISAENAKYLLHGVTGSGKTEVYMSLIERVLAEGKTAIMLVPEISLTPQILRIFRGRFGEDVAMLHSGLSSGERRNEWVRLITGTARIAVGARSAVFAPLKNLGIIIIDEEHDQSYISESNPRFNTVEVAEKRCEINGAKLVLGSATPSVDTYRLAKDGVYKLVELIGRVNNKKMPEIDIVDMSWELRQGNTGIFSGELEEALKSTLARGEQAMIFLNRRGYASFVICRECGYTAKCTDCDVSLTYHNHDDRLKCHYCGKRFRMLTHCPNCASEKIRYGKIGTERVQKDLEKLMPGVRVLRMDNDTTTTKTAYLDILTEFAGGGADILVGTQMIAKGHDFSRVTLVGILDADMSLYFSDYNSPERTFQLVTQVAGRAGRGAISGKVILQTYTPRHYVFRFAKDYDYKGFYDKEINSREVTKFPPFSKIVRVMITSLNEDKARAAAREVYGLLRSLKDKKPESFIYMQAMKSPVSMIQKKFRYQVIMRIAREDEADTLDGIYGAADAVKVRDVSVFCEINPSGMS